MSLLATQNLSLCQGERELISGLNLRIGAGEAWIVLGENGCGKSTLLSALAGWFHPSGGEVLLGDKPITQVTPAQRAKQIAWQTQQDQCPFPLTALEKALTGRHPHLSRWEWESATDLALAQLQLARLDLADFAERDLASLSGGERRRCSLAALLLNEHDLVILDEPTNLRPMLYCYLVTGNGKQGYWLIRSMQKCLASYTTIRYLKCSRMEKVGLCR